MRETPHLGALALPQDPVGACTDRHGRSRSSMLWEGLRPEDRAFLLSSRLGQGRQQFVFAEGREARRAWPVQALSAFPGQQVGK